MRLTGLTPGTTYHYRVRSADAAGNATTDPAAASAPATFRVPQAVTRTPAAVALETGTLRAGGASALAADDNAYYQVNSTTTGTRTTSWYGSFTGVPAGLSDAVGDLPRAQLALVHAGDRGLALDRQHLAAAQLVAPSRTRRRRKADLVPAGAPAGYVSPTGEVRVRVRCTTTANFFASGELMQLTYEAP